MWACLLFGSACHDFAGPYVQNTDWVDLVRSLSGGASILRWKECAKCTRLTLSERGGKCSGFSRMQLKMQVQSERFVLMLAFMIDLHEVLKGVSECFQADKTTLADVGQREG